MRFLSSSAAIGRIDAVEGDASDIAWCIAVDEVFAPSSHESAESDGLHRCHAINENAMVPIKATAAVEAAIQAHSEEGCDFKKLEIGQCAKCHTAQAAGDACVKCHRYHPPTLSFGLQ